MIGRHIYSLDMQCVLARARLYAHIDNIAAREMQHIKNAFVVARAAAKSRQLELERDLKSPKSTTASMALPIQVEEWPSTPEMQELLKEEPDRSTHGVTACPKFDCCQIKEQKRPDLTCSDFGCAGPAGVGEVPRG